MESRIHSLVKEAEMALITESPVRIFDLSQIRCGDLLWGRHCTWKDGKAGFVTSATEKQLIVQYYPGIGNVTNHFVILASEVMEEQWEIRWSSDLSKVQEHTTAEEEAGDEPE